MKDDDCVRFLQGVLPHLELKWSGYRKVRRTVCKRVGRRMRELGLADLDGFCARFLPPRVYGASVLGVIGRTDGTLRFRQRLARGPLGLVLCPSGVQEPAFACACGNAPARAA